LFFLFVFHQKKATLDDEEYSCRGTKVCARPKDEPGARTIARLTWLGFNGSNLAPAGQRHVITMVLLLT
jgi:hypothetical protein